MTIGEAARLTGLAESTLRFYERRNLLDVGRDSGGRRDFSEEDVAWIQFICRLKETGMPLKDIERYAALRAQGKPTMRERLLMLREHRTVVLARLGQWEECLRHLDGKIALYENAING